MKIAYKIAIILCILNIAYPNEAFKNYDERVVSKNPSAYIVSEKYDGIRGIWNGKELRTRQGNLINAPKCFLDKLPNFSLDGELWIDYANFEEISSITRLKNPSCEDYSNVKYLIFDTEYKKELDVESRLRELSYIIKSPNIIVLEQIRLDSNFKATLKNMLDSVIKRGGEGLILRFDSLGSGTSFKLKPYSDAECKVVGYVEGKGKFSNKVGSIICSSILPSDLNEEQRGSFKEGVEFKIGSGLSNELRANPPKIGSIITYKYNGFSKNGIPKHASFLRVRE